MIYRTFREARLSLLGFGGMRLPRNADGTIDEAETQKMVDYAMSHGVNYFDTAYPYHNGTSELMLGKALSKYPRDSYVLADKYPGHQIADTYDPADIFEEQLKKCGTNHFDFYLLHNVCENSVATYTDPRWGIVPYFLEQKKRGRIRHLGFSTHARPDTLQAFLDRYGDVMEFCQIQLNYLDISMQDAAAKCAMLKQKNIPIIVMEPLRGGKLASPGEGFEKEMRAKYPDFEPVAWAFRYLFGMENILTILSGMSSPEQLAENVAIFDTQSSLTEKEADDLCTAAKQLTGAVPCTACGYCKASCPMQLDIPMLLAAYSDLRYQSAITVPMQMDALPEDKKPSACIGCGGCAAICPQKIDIPSCMADFAKLYAEGPNWAKMCRERAEAAKKLRGEG